MSQCIDCDSLFVRAIDQCEGKISQKHTPCFMLRWRACQWVCENTSWGILYSLKKLTSKPCINSMIVINLSKNLKPCRLDKTNTIHCRI